MSMGMPPMYPPYLGYVIDPNRSEHYERLETITRRWFALSYWAFFRALILTFVGLGLLSQGIFHG